MLYVCPTPIGNLEDITLRVLRVLDEVDLILAEDTRRSGQLLHHFSIKNRLESLHEHNEREKTAKILELLRSGREIALISDAGMPGISDPGGWLIKRVIEEGLPVEVLPGANAALVAYLQSGFLSPHFLFYGFLPRREKECTQVLSELKELPFPVIFYEAPHRITTTLEYLQAVLGGEREVSISRELTKRYEETKRGTLAEMIRYYRAEKPRGEFVIIVNGAKQQRGKEIKEDDIFAALETLISSGMTRKSAVEEISSKYRLPKNLVYQIALQIKH